MSLDHDALRVENAALKADLTYFAKLIKKLRGQFINIADHVEDEGDRAYFGSTNHADDFKQAVRALDDANWSLILDKAKGRDLYAEMRKLRATITELRAEVAKLTKERDEAILSEEIRTHERDHANDIARELEAKRPKTVVFWAKKLRAALNRAETAESALAKSEASREAAEAEASNLREVIFGLENDIRIGCANIDRETARAEAAEARVAEARKVIGILTRTAEAYRRFYIPEELPEDEAQIWQSLEHAELAARTWMEKRP